VSESSATSDRPSFLDAKGARTKILPDDVQGRFLKWRRIAYFLLVLHYLALPFIKNGKHPAVHLDIEARRFYLAGQAFNAQDVWLVVFLLGAFAFGLVFVTSLAGRVWCGWACPQTVFLDGIFRPNERLINGSREERLRGAKGELTFSSLLRVLLTHLLYVLAALFVAHVFVA